MKNSLTDLNNHLFEQLERLNDDDLIDEDLSKEIERSKAMANVASKIIETADLGLQAAQLRCEYGSNREVELPTMLEVKKNG